MAEDTMVKEVLTEAMIEAGAELTAKLDSMGLPIDAAFWWWDEEINSWLLFFSSPELSVRPDVVYEKVVMAERELGEKVAAIPFLGIRMRPSPELVRGLRARLQTGPELRRIRLHRTYADASYIDDALVYRAA